MTYKDSILGGCFETISKKPNQQTLDSQHNEDDSTQSTLSGCVVDYEGQHNELSVMSELQRKVLDDNHTKSLKIMLGAAWVDGNGYKMLHRFPEVLFSDSTFGSNNKGQPLFNTAGQDSDGRAFVPIRTFLPNDGLPFFMWVWVRVLVQMFGQGLLSRVNLLLLDGDAQEFTAMDKAMERKVLPNAIQCWCGRRIIEPTFKKECGDLSSMQNVSKAPKYCALIKTWVYHWLNGKSCATKEQYELSKDLLFHFLQTNKDCSEAIGPLHLNRIKKWLRSNVIIHEDNFAFYLRCYVRCFDECMTNIVEGINYASKKLDISAKPNMSLKKSAKNELL